MTFEIREKSLDLASLLFAENGWNVPVLERDGNTVRYHIPKTQRETIGEVGKDLFILGQLKSIEAQFMALRSSYLLQGGRSKDVPIGMKTKGFGLICVFNGNLSYRFFKQGGRVPHFAPVSETEAKGLILGTHELRYIKGGNGYRIAVK